jgi:GlpG protein
MRHIGDLPDEKHARVFGDFLTGCGVGNQVEPDRGASWSVWVMEEDQVPASQEWLEYFRANPTAPEFRGAKTEAARVREAEAEDLAAYHRRIRTRRSIFPRFGGYGVGFLTYALIFACVIVATYSKVGDNLEALRRLFITEGTGEGGKLLPEVFSGEIWRLFTPMFIHFGWLHLLFNMMWLFQLGCMIEARQSSWLLALLVGVIALLSNVAQFLVTHRAIFGGMSGVVYGLAGYVWIRGMFDRKSGLFLDSQSVTILLVWLVVCYSGWVGSIANTVHLVGLITGVVWGYISAMIGSRRPEP